MGKGFDIGTFALIMMPLYIGGMIAGGLSQYIPFFNTGGYIGGILVAIIEMILLVFVGLATGKMGLWTIIFGGIVIFVGGIAGGFLAGYVNLSGAFATVLTLAIQTGLLMLVGLVRGVGGKTPMKVK